MFVLVAVFASPFLISDVFATHLSENTKWQLVYLTDTPVCSNYDYQMSVKYDEITEKYFGLYQFENTKYDSLCMNTYKYDEQYETPQDLDLLIIVYSKNLGEVQLHSTQMGGLFTHSGPNKSLNNAIMICDCSNFYYSDPVWILTHELSHFILYFLEFDVSVIEDLVHKYDDKYDGCMQSFDNSCLTVMTKLRVENMAYTFSVMPPLKEAIGISKLKNNDVDISPSFAELGKVVTKWWAAGKITEGDYSNALGLLAEHDQLRKESHNVLFKDGPLEKDRIIWNEFLLADGSNKSKEVMSNVRKKLHIEESVLQTDFTGLPEWFKNTAQWWVDGKISNEDFVRSVTFLKESGIIRARD
jgi:hypothetical protein